MPPLTGRVIAGRYNLQSPIGRGAMGVVWRAHDRLLDREVAVKEVVISALIGADERRNAYQRTMREARTAARLSHSGVVAIYDVVEEDGRPWIIMELVPSRSLDQLLVVRKRLPPARTGRIGQQLLSALAAAHRAGVLHRDVKPSNVLIADSRAGESWDERAVLTDFGIAQFEGDPRLTQTGMVMGSPGFTAPERIRGSDATSASDLWSLGATIYAAVEGRGPYENRGGAITTMSAIINEDAPVAPHAGPLAPVIAALLRRDPAARPSASMATRMFAQALLLLPNREAEPSASAHPPTIRSTYLPRPAAAPKAATPVTTPDAAHAGGKPAIKGQPAKEKPSKEILVTRATAVGKPTGEAPPAMQEPEEAKQEAGEAAEAAIEKAAEESAEANSATPDPEPEPAASPAAAADAEPGSKADAETKLDAQTEPDAGTEAEPDADAGADTETEPEADGEAAADAESKAEAAEPEPEPESEAEPEEKPAAPAEAEAKPAAETAKFAASAQEPAVPDVPGPPPADAPAAERKAAVAALLVPGPGDEESGSRKDPPAERPTPPTPVPMARVAPSAPAPAQQKPTFTAAKPTDRAVPTFSAVNPARAATPGRPSPGRRTPGRDQGGAAKGYPPPGKGGIAQFSGATFSPQSGRGAGFAGPSLPSPDLARQYPPGTGGGAGKRRRLGRKSAWAAAAVLVAAAIGVGTALALNSGGTANAGNAHPTAVPSVEDTHTGFRSIDALNDPSTALPGPGWQTQTVTQADAQSAAGGFSIDVPPGWQETSTGLEIDFHGPAGMLLEVDLTQQSTSDMLASAGQVESSSKSRFADYKRVSLQAEPVRHAEGALWKFQWTSSGGVRETTDDIFFAQATSSGVQDYAVYIRSPSALFSAKALPLFEQMLRTFQVVPAS